MKNYHMQIRYTIQYVEEIPIGYKSTWHRCRETILLDWTNIEDAPLFEDMEKQFATKDKVFGCKLFLHIFK